jgi:hypothetical protein
VSQTARVGIIILAFFAALWGVYQLLNWLISGMQDWP